MPVLPLIIVAAVLVVLDDPSTVALLLFPRFWCMEGLEDLFQDDMNHSGVVIAANDTQIHGIDDLFDASGPSANVAFNTAHKGIDMHQYVLMVY